MVTIYCGIINQIHLRCVKMLGKAGQVTSKPAVTRGFHGDLISVQPDNSQQLNAKELGEPF